MCKLLYSILIFHEKNQLNIQYCRIKQGMLQALVNEPEKFVKNAVVQFIAIIGKHEFPNNTWPEVLQFIYTLCNSESLQDKEVCILFPFFNKYI